MIVAPSAWTRHALAAAVVALLCAWIGRAFWLQDLRWSLPTARPIGLVQPALGSKPRLAPALEEQLGPQVPALLHFFNPGCPCSRFNLDHVRELQAEFAGRIRVVFVLQGEDAAELASAARELDLGRAAGCVPDLDGAIAHACGVYSTPQAVVLDGEGALAYRGNYNSARFCVDPATQYARLALEDLLAGRRVRPFDARATTAYGCPLPADPSEERP